MKYFIGYLISGEASDWHIKMTKKISDEFNTWKIYQKVPPHITIFYPDGVEDISEIKKYIKSWVENNKASGNFYISGFGHFDDRVVFAKIEQDESVRKSVENLREGVRQISQIKNEQFPKWHPHSTLMNKIDSEKIKQIWKYVNGLDKPNFTLPFDNIAIFKYTSDQKWVVDEVFKLS